MKNLLKPKAQELLDNSLDIYSPKAVEVIKSEDGTRVWVNVDGVCVLRIGDIPTVSKGTTTGRMSCNSPNIEEIPREKTRDLVNIRNAFVFGMDYGKGMDETAFMEFFCPPPVKKVTFVIGRRHERTVQLAVKHNLRAVSHPHQLIGNRDAILVVEDGWEKRSDYQEFYATIMRQNIKAISYSVYREIKDGER